MKGLTQTYHRGREGVGELTKFEGYNYEVKFWTENGKVTDVSTKPFNPLCQPEISILGGVEPKISVSEIIDIRPDEVDKLIEYLKNAKDLSGILEQMKDNYNKTGKFE